MTYFNRFILLVGVVLLVLFLATACAMTDQQIDSIASAAQRAAEVGAQIGAPAVGLDSGAAAGVAGAVGTGSFLLIRLLLKRFQKT